MGFVCAPNCMKGEAVFLRRIFLISAIRKTFHRLASASTLFYNSKCNKGATKMLVFNCIFNFFILFFARRERDPFPTPETDLLLSSYARLRAQPFGVFVLRRIVQHLEAERSEDRADEGSDQKTQLNAVEKGHFDSKYYILYYNMSNIIDQTKVL